MSYEPTEWKAGDTVTSAKLNKIEQGITNNNNIIETCTYYEEEGDSYTHYRFKTIHTITEILEWCNAGKRVIFCFPTQNNWAWPQTEYYPVIRYGAIESESLSIAATEGLTVNRPACHLSEADVDLEDHIVFDIYSPD